MIDSNGECLVDDFVIGRDGYGNVMFPGETNVANLNLDEIGEYRKDLQAGLNLKDFPTSQDK